VILDAGCIASGFRLAAGGGAKAWLMVV